MSYKKYYLYKEQISYDGGTTWQDVTPSVTTPSGDPIGTYETYEQCTGGTPPTPTACTCDAFAFEGTSEGNNTYRIEIPSGETAVTAASWNTDCGIVPQDFVHTDDAGFQEIVTDGHWAYDNNIIRFTASTNPTAFVREGNMTITYTVNGVSCTKVTHLVQAAGRGFDGKYKLTLNNHSVVSASCDSTSAITSGEVATQYSGTVVSAEIGNCVKSIDKQAFYDCSNLTSIAIPNSVTSIKYAAFDNCASLTSLTIPNSVTSIGDAAFADCKSLSSLTIPDSLTSIGWSAFADCTGLTSVTIGTGLTIISKYAFNSCTDLTSVTIPDNVTTIEENCFQLCSGMTSVVIGTGITRIDDYAFAYCTSLTSVIINSLTPPTIGQSTFTNTNNCPIYVPAESVNAYKSASGWWSSLSSRIQAIP